MKTLKLALISLAAIVFSRCSNSSKKQTIDINFNDTVYKTNTQISEKGDTIFEKEKICFYPVDPSIDTSGFYYTASPREQWSKEKTYSIFFDRKRVIAYCDSILKTYPPNPNNELDGYFNVRNFYNDLRGQASLNKMDETEGSDELATLLDLFPTIILNTSTGDKPQYIIVTEAEDYSSYNKYFSIKTAAGDTIMLAGTLGYSKEDWLYLKKMGFLKREY